MLQRLQYKHPPAAVRHPIAMALAGQGLSMKRVLHFTCVLLMAVTPAFSQQKPGLTPQTQQSPQTSSRKVDRAAAYYHYSMAHIYEELVAVYGRSDLANKAIEEYRQAIDADPSSSYLTSGLAELYAKTGRIRDAVLEAQDIIKRDPNNLEAHKLLGRIYLRSMGDIQAGSQGGGQNVLKLAIEQYEQIIKLDTDPANLVDDHLLLGRLYRLNNDLQKAENEFKTAVKLQPDSEEAVTTLAYLYNEEGDSARAIQALNSIPDPQRSAKLYSALGYTYEQQKEYKNAIAAYRHAIELDRDNLDAIRGLAQNLMNDGQMDAALDQYKIIDTYRESKQWSQAAAAAKEAVEKLPNDRGLKMVLASQLADSGQPEVGLQQVKSLLTGKPEDREVYIALAQMYSRLKRWNEAEEAISKAEQLSTKPDDKQYTNFVKGSIYERQKKYEPAETQFKQILAADPQNAMTLNYFGYMLADRGVRLDEALGYIKKAVELEPANGAYLDSLGWAYFKLGKYDLAEENLNKGIQHTPNDPTVQDHLGDVYQKTGRLRLAAAHWERALQEWNRTIPAEMEASEMAKVQKKLESAKIKLAKEEPQQK